MLEAGIKHVPTEERPAIQDQIKKMRGQVAYLEKEIAQIRADIKALSENAGPAIALAIVARSVAAATARELLSRFDGGNLTSGSIDELVRRGLESDLLAHGQGEGGFEWSGRPYHSKITGNPSAFRVIPRIVEEITRIDEERVARRAAAARWHFSAKDAVEHLGGPEVTLSELFDGADGYAVVALEDPSRTGHIFLKRREEKVFIVGGTTLTAVNAALKNQNDSFAEREVSLKNGMLHHGHYTVRTALQKQWIYEAPLREAMKKAKLVESELNEFGRTTEGTAFNLEVENYQKFLKPTTAGKGHWFIEASWGNPKRRDEPRTPFGVVVKKFGAGKVQVVFVTSTWPQGQPALDKETVFEVANLPANLRAVLRAAFYQLGVHKDYPATIAKITS